jgi:ribonucleoside-diphosphate reductase alpha chain
VAHDVVIADDAGRPLFTQEGVLAPRGWSPRAVQIAASKYLHGDPAQGRDPTAGGRESSIYHLHERVANFIARKGEELGYFPDPYVAERFRLELLGLTLGQSAAFNSPVWFNVGVGDYGIVGDNRAWAWVPGGDPEGGAVCEVRDTYRYPQGSACFIQSVEDDLESIMELARNECIIFKHGSGTGTDFSKIRSRKEKLSNGGTPSGPVSFLKVYDRIAATIKSGGRTRRAAKMQTLGIWHPDILDFIRAKGREELKVQALIEAGYPADFNGEAYDTVAFQNANFSVRVPRRFFDHLDAGRPWPLVAVTTGAVIERVDPAELWRAVALETWRCGDPGVQFNDTINDWHTTPFARDGTPTPINCSNPCSEYLSIDDSACNLASLNLMRFLTPDGRGFRPTRLMAAVRLLVVAQDILVDSCSYPTEAIARNAHACRQLGLGFSNLGALLQSWGVPYDSDAGRDLASALTALICGQAYRTSARLARALGPFDAWSVNREAMSRVIDKHAEELDRLLRRLPDGPAVRSRAEAVARDVAGYALSAWDEAQALGDDTGFRNAQVTAIAPTGTISFMMDCDTTGIEPNLALVAVKHLAGGGSIPVVNRVVARALEALAYDEPTRAKVCAYILRHGTAEGCPDLDPADLPVFDTSFAPPGFSRTLRWEAHLLMTAAVQPWVTGSISKTVNVPHEFSVDQVAACYRLAHDLGLKCVAIYRDGSKGSQPLVAANGAAPAPAEGDPESTCPSCGHVGTHPAGTCRICPNCGTPDGGCA